MPNATILRAAIDGMIDETVRRCGQRALVPQLSRDAERIRNMIGAYEVAIRLDEADLANEIYGSLQRGILRLARACVLAE